MIFKSTKDVVQVNDVFLLKIIGGSGLRDCQLHFTSPTSSVKANETAVFHFVQNVFPKASGLSAHFIRRLPRWAPYPKPFKQTLRVRLAFLLLVCLRKQAFATASKQKSLSLCDRLCSHNRSQFGRICWGY